MTRIIRIMVGAAFALGVLTVLFIVMVYNALTWTPPSPSATKVDISKTVPQTNGDATYFPLNIQDEYSRYAIDIDKMVASFEASHPEICFSNRWDDFEHASFRRPPMIYGVKLYHTPRTPPAPTQTTETTTTSTRTTRTARR